MVEVTVTVVVGQVGHCVVTVGYGQVVGSGQLDGGGGQLDPGVGPRELGAAVPVCDGHVVEWGGQVEPGVDVGLLLPVYGVPAFSTVNEDERR